MAAAITNTTIPSAYQDSILKPQTNPGTAFADMFSKVADQNLRRQQLAVDMSRAAVTNYAETVKGKQDFYNSTRAMQMTKDLDAFNDAKNNASIDGMPLEHALGSQDKATQDAALQKLQTILSTKTESGIPWSSIPGVQQWLESYSPDALKHQALAQKRDYQTVMGGAATTRAEGALMGGEAKLQNAQRLKNKDEQDKAVQEATDEFNNDANGPLKDRLRSSDPKVHADAQKQLMQLKSMADATKNKLAHDTLDMIDPDGKFRNSLAVKEKIADADASNAATNAQNANTKASGNVPTYNINGVKYTEPQVIQKMQMGDIDDKTTPAGDIYSQMTNFQKLKPGRIVGDALDIGDPSKGQKHDPALFNPYAEDAERIKTQAMQAKGAAQAPAASTPTAPAGDPAAAESSLIDSIRAGKGQPAPGAPAAPAGSVMLYHRDGRSAPVPANQAQQIINMHPGDVSTTPFPAAKSGAAIDDDSSPTPTTADSSDILQSGLQSILSQFGISGSQNASQPQGLASLAA